MSLYMETAWTERKTKKMFRFILYNNSCAVALNLIEKLNRSKKIIQAKKRHFIISRIFSAFICLNKLLLPRSRVNLDGVN
jgi:hypothetical protein